MKGIQHNVPATPSDWQDPSDIPERNEVKDPAAPIAESGRTQYGIYTIEETDEINIEETDVDEEKQIAEWWNIYGEENTETDCYNRVEEFNLREEHYGTCLNPNETWDLKEEDCLEYYYRRAGNPNLWKLWAPDWATKIGDDPEDWHNIWGETDGPRTCMQRINQYNSQALKPIDQSKRWDMTATHIKTDLEPLPHRKRYP